MAGKTPIYDPNTGETHMLSNEDVFRLNNESRNETGQQRFAWYYTPEGVRVYGHRPEQSYFDPQLEGRVVGINPSPPAPSPPRYTHGDHWDDYAGVDPNHPREVANGGDGWTDPNWQPNPPPAGGGTQAPPVSWQPNPQTPQFGANQPDFGDMWTRQFDIGEGFSGRNKEFYDTQFSNLLAQQQGFQDNQLLAAMKHQNAVNNPQQPTAVDWSWANNGQGLPEVVVAGQPNWVLNRGLGPDATNQQVLETFGPQLSTDAQKFWLRDVLGWKKGGDGRADTPGAIPGANGGYYYRPDGWSASDDLLMTNYAGAGSPDALINQSRLDPSAHPYLNELAMAIYRNTTPQTGPGNVPAGYAAPISGG